MRGGRGGEGVRCERREEVAWGGMQDDRSGAGGAASQTEITHNVTNLFYTLGGEWSAESDEGDPSSFLAFLELLHDFPGLRWLWGGVVTMRIRILGLKNSKSEMKNVGSKSRAARPPVGWHTVLPGGRLSSRVAESTKSSKGSRKISPSFASSPDKTQKSNYILYMFSFVSKLGGYQLLPGKNKQNDYVALKGTPISIAWPHSDTITASTCMFGRLVLQTDGAIMMLLDKLGPTLSHVAATKRKGQPHIVHGKLEQGGSAAPLLARDTKTEPEGFAYVKEVVKIRYGKMARKHIRHNEQGINDDLYAFVQKPIEDGRQPQDFKGVNSSESILRFAITSVVVVRPVNTRHRWDETCLLDIIVIKSTDVVGMALPVQNINHSAFRSMFEKEKLSGNNFNDWFARLKLVLRVEKKMHVIEQPLPPAPEAGAEPNIVAQWTALYDAHTEIACLMLGSMTPELHRQFELHYPYDMVQELRSMFEKQAGVEK
ncbi:hypothetical protein Tco_0305014 [Tanacetum coccineum]